MSEQAASGPARQTVSRARSRDGTEIGWWTSGEGPPVVLVHGGLGDHTRWDALRPYLEPHFSVHAMDRRGRGASGDAAEYAIEREYEDVAAVLDAVAAAAGQKVGVYCSSYGGVCAFGAVPLTESIERLALYEAWPPVNPEEFAYPNALIERVEALLETGDREALLEIAYREVLGMGDDELAFLKAQPEWKDRVAAAPTIPRELRAFPEVPFDPDRAALVTVPTLLLTGSETEPSKAEVETVLAALPDARVAVLAGQGHVADLFAPEVVAEPLVPFLRGDS